MSDEKKSEQPEAQPETPARTWPHVVTLKQPIDFGSRRITSLEFRRGRAGDMKGVALRDDIPADDLMKIASRLCGEPPGVIEQLDIDDVGEVTDIALDFYVRFLAAGRKSSR